MINLFVMLVLLQPYAGEDSLVRRLVYPALLGMSGKGNPDFWHCMLCKHGPTCRRHKEHTCEFAHSLSELRPPYERYRTYNGVWKDGVDKWFGQAMARYDVNRVKWYYKNTPANDIPVWAHGVNWYHNPQADQAQFDRFPADFGIEEAWLAVRANRKSGRRPFEWAENLWPRIEERKRRLEAKVVSDIPAPDAEPDEVYRAKEEEPADRETGDSVCDGYSESKQEVQSGCSEGMNIAKDQVQDDMYPAKEKPESPDRAMGHDVCDDNSEPKQEVPSQGSAEGMMKKKRYGFEAYLRHGGRTYG